MKVSVNSELIFSISQRDARKLANFLLNKNPNYISFSDDWGFDITVAWLKSGEVLFLIPTKEDVKKITLDEQSAELLAYSIVMRLEKPKIKFTVKWNNEVRRVLCNIQIH